MLNFFKKNLEIIYQWLKPKMKFKDLIKIIVDADLKVWGVKK